MNGKSGSLKASLMTYLILVATQKVDSMVGYKLLVVEPYRLESRQRKRLATTGRTFIAVDTLGAGEDDPSLNEAKAKSVVNECVRRNRLGDPDYSPLPEAVEERLKPMVGHLYWRRARSLLDAYCHRQHIRVVSHNNNNKAEKPVASSPRATPPASCRVHMVPQSQVFPHLFM